MSLFRVTLLLDHVCIFADHVIQCLPTVCYVLERGHESELKIETTEFFGQISFSICHYLFTHTWV